MTLSTLTKLRRQSGFTLVELLIVMLIVGILSIAMLPMYKKYMTKAKYTAEGLPILATIKTQIDLFCYEQSYAPGTADTVYCWEKTAASASGAAAGYIPKKYALIGDRVGISLQDFNATTGAGGATAIEKWHLRDLIKEAELQGKLIHPNHVFYACINPGLPEALDPTGSAKMPGDYGYAIGVFGDGNGLPLNSGVATMEVHMSAPEVGTDADDNMSYGVTVLGSWSNFDGLGTNPDISTSGGINAGQIMFVDAAGSAGSSGAASTTALLSGCGIWSQSTMGSVNQSGKSLQDVQDTVDSLVDDGVCGKWEFPKYVQ